MVKGKKHICSTFEIRKYFKSFQGTFEKNSNWYNRLEGIVIANYIKEEYRHFLAQPIVEADTIHWYADFDETAVRLTELSDDIKEKYLSIKNDTILHYQNVVNSLKQQGKTDEAGYLELAIKFIDDRFIYCFEDKVVLAVWGMQLRDKIQDPFGNGLIAKSVFRSNSIKEEVIKTNGENTNDVKNEEKDIIEELPQFTIRFTSDDTGSFEKEKTEYIKNHGDEINANEIPRTSAKNGYDFEGWSENPMNHIVTGDKTFNAQYKRWPWYKRLWYWFKTTGWKWLLAILLILLILCLLLRGCSHHEEAHPIPSDITEKPWIDTDPNSGKGGIYNPGDPYGERPATPPEYANILPPNQGVLPPLDSTELIRNPDEPTIVGNRLNILMENADKDIMDLAKAFKEVYPEDKYKVVYYDNVVKRMQIELPQDERKKLSEELPSKLPDYEIFVFDEALFVSNQIPNDPAYKSPDKSWYLKAINAPQAWEVTKGTKAITVAVVDNGFNLNHPELKSKTVMPYNVWTHSKSVFPQKEDHGTHVAGTALAIMDNGIGLCGVAPNASFMPVQVANEHDLTTTTSILDGILYALYQGADVINISMGLEFTETLPAIVQEQLKNQFKHEERLWKHVMKIAENHNSVIVIAAGNNNILAGIDPVQRPDNFIIVSAVDKNENQLQKADFSNYGQRSTISAPGVDIYSTVGNGKYAMMSGTSMAAPIITGAVALMKSLNDTLTTQQIICALQSTGKPTSGNIGSFLQLDKALKKVISGDFENCKIEASIPSSGDVQILLSWDNYNDLDLVCVDPFGDAIWFENKKVKSGGQLEIDMNVKPLNKKPIEHIFWPSGEAPNGTYNVYVLYYENHKDKAPLETSYKLNIKYGSETKEYKGVMNNVQERKHISSFTIGNGNDHADSENSSSDDRISQLESERKLLEKQLDRINKELEQINNHLKNK